jgi:malate dehydrogenase (oxaloacetate-decarboxylating)(NADP+)
MADRPIIFALANPTPEILPAEVKSVRSDAIIATGRSDYPNQVNNVLCFPFIFRGALDVGATTINEEMKLATVNAIAALAHAEQSDIVATAYGEKGLSFGPEYLIPKPFDPRLIVMIAPAVARAAMESGVATRPIVDFDAYRDSLTRFVYQSGASMKTVFSAARQGMRRVAYAEGESERVLRAVQVVIDERLAHPILVGRPDKIRQRVESFGLRIRDGVNCDFVNIDADPRYHETWTEYYRLTRRRGVSYEDARDEVRRRNTLVAAMLVHRGDADAMLCGTVGRYASHMRHVTNVIGLRKGASTFAGMNMLTLPEHTVFLCDTLVNPDPTPQQLTEITLLAVEQVRRFGVLPRVALLCHSSFGSSDAPSARKMREVMALLEADGPDFELEGEMQGDAALSKPVLDRVFPDSRLTSAANLLIMPNLDAANIAYNLLKVTAGGGITVGPILLGAAKPVHILDPASSVRRIVNMTALAAVDAGIERGR